MYKMTQYKAERAYTGRVQPSVMRITEKRLLDAFQIEYDYASSRLRTAPLHLVKCVLMGMAQTGTRVDVFDQNAEG